VSGGFTVCGVGCEISFCVCRRGVDRVCLGGVVKISFMSTNNYIYKYVTFFICVILYWNIAVEYPNTK